VITGGTGVLGGFFASALASAGAKVAVLGRNKEKAAGKVREINDSGGEAMELIADVLEEAQVTAAKERVLEKWGKIDGLINAAGGNVPESVVSPDQDLFSVKVEN